MNSEVLRLDCPPVLVCGDLSSKAAAREPERKQYDNQAAKSFTPAIDTLHPTAQGSQKTSPSRLRHRERTLPDTVAS